MFKVVVKGLTKEFERSYRDYVYGTMAAAATAAVREAADTVKSKGRANIAAGKEKRRNDKAIGAHGQTIAGRWKNRLIIAGGKKIVGEGGIKYFIHKLR